jgi:AraC-like DNA-binding protein
VNKIIELSKGADFFGPEVPIFVNRVSEQFHLLEHEHDFLEICYVWEGSGFHYIEDQVLRVTKGDLFFIPIGVSHVFRPASSAHGNRLIVGNCIFEQKVAETIIAALPALVGSYRFRHMLPSAAIGWLRFREQGSEFGNLFDRMHREYQLSAPGFQTMLLAMLLELLTLLERRMGDHAHKQELLPSKNDRIEAVLHFIRTHLHEPVRLGNAAAGIGLSERQLSRLLLAHTGLSFSALLTMERMERACELLACGSATAANIAQQVGLQDMKHFHRLFKQHTGMTPMQYRKLANAPV